MFWGRVKAKKKKIGQGGCGFGSSPKRLQRPHPQLVHWWLLVHSSLANLPNSYSLGNVVDANSPISIVIFCILVLLVCLQVSVFNVSYSITTTLLSLFLQWNGFLASWCLFLEEMRITMEGWLMLVLQK
jgi:hypothetical protein